MSIKTWTLEKDNSIKCQQLTPEYLKDALDLVENAFFRRENICKATGIVEDPEAIADLRKLASLVVKDGVTVIAIDTKNNRVVGGAFNKLQVKNSAEDASFFEDFAKSCKSPRSLAAFQLIGDVEDSFDLFEHCKVDCLLEIMFLTTLPEYGGKGIGLRLSEISIELAKNLLNGFNIKIPVDGQKLSLEPVPKIVSAVFTTFITQKIGKRLGFQIVARRNYEELEYEGKSYASVIGKETAGLTFEYKRIDQ